MRFMVLMPATPESEQGVLPSEDDLNSMMSYNEQLVKAGVMLAGEGLHASSKGVRVSFDNAGKTTVVDGPFTEAKELIAGFWLWQVSSKEEAVEWAKRCPVRGITLELRQIFEADDFGAALTDELREKEASLRALSESR
jgi:hypothetical protein